MGRYSDRDPVMSATALLTSLLFLSGTSDPEVTTATNALHAQVQQVEPATQGTATAIAAGQDTGLVYSSSPACVRGEGADDAVYYGCAGQATCGEEGLLYWTWAQSPDGQIQSAGSYCAEPGSPEAPVTALTPGRILEAFRRIPVPSPSIGVNPVGGRTLVNFDTILHTQAQPFTETVQLLGRRVTFEIEPSEFSWRTGQGEGFTTSDPGQAYQASLPMSAYVTHRYLRAGDVQLGLDTTWTARWRVGDGPWRPVDGTVTTTSDPVSLEVVTARPQLVSYD